MKALLFSVLVGSCFLCLGQAQDKLSFKNGDISKHIVYANKKHNKTNLFLEKGGKYHITAEGEWQDANFEPTDAEGFAGFTKAMKKGNFLKPMKNEPYMKLIARIKGKKIAIGKGSTFIAKRKGRLVLMPNDATFFFGNNHGTLEVTIKRLE